jgi:nucleotide-binding universal stress UspA family protein
MLQKILVPSDGSSLSECALPLAKAVASAQGAEVVFAQVVELPRWTGAEPDGYVSADVYDEIISALEDEARRNLDSLAALAQQAGIRTSSVLRQGSPSIALLDIETEQHPDLVVMGSHGRTGLARFTLGSVADRLVREGTAPVLVVRSFGAEATRLQRALVPLDGSDVAEEALQITRELAGKPLRAILLVRAVATPTEQSAATDYLERTAQKMRDSGLQVDTAVRVSEPATAIEASAPSVDLVIMATHGRGGIDRMRHGSVAERATRHLGVPVLLVRAGSAHAMDAGSAGNSRPGV